MKTDLPARDGYMVLCKELGFPNGKSHVWTGNDTLCRMWSTGGLNRERYWKFFESPPTEMCHQCATVRKRLDNWL